MPDIVIPEGGELTPELCKLLGIDPKFKSVKAITTAQEEAQTALGQANTTKDQLAGQLEELQGSFEELQGLLGADDDDGQGGDKGGDQGGDKDDDKPKVDAQPPTAQEQLLEEIQKRISAGNKEFRENWEKERQTERDNELAAKAEKEIDRQGKALLAEVGAEDFQKHLPELKKRLNAEVTPTNLRSDTAKRVYTEILSDIAADEQSEREKKFLASVTRGAAEMGTGQSVMGDGTRRVTMEDWMEAPIEELEAQVEAELKQRAG
jgi:hypothetical protein